MVQLYNRILFAKKNEVLIHATDMNEPWKKHHAKRKATYYIVPYIRNIQNRPIYRNRK